MSAAITIALGDLLVGEQRDRNPGWRWRCAARRRNGTAPGGATAHIVAITGYDRYSGQFKVQDPARRGPVMVSAETLEAFMQGNAGALAIFNPRQMATQGWRASY